MKPPRNFSLCLSSAFGLGYAPKAPGTFGTLAGIPLWWAMSDLSPLVFVAATLGWILLAFWVSDHADRIYGDHDSGKIVIDEVVGFLVAAIGIPFTWPNVLAVFVLFRIFDITKPPPIGYLDERVSGGVGVVVDDLVAGAFACVILHAVLLFLG